MHPSSPSGNSEYPDEGWYTRRQGVVRGPFPAERITTYLLLGRIRMDDELSQDRMVWSPAEQLTSLLPAELRQQSCWDDYRELVVAQMKVDERKLDRRSGKSKHYLDTHAEQRTSPDRRSDVDNDLLNHCLLSIQKSDDRGLPVSRRFRPVVLVMILASLVFAWLSPIQS